MRILHTSDWHLGKKLDHFSRLEEQKLVMQEIIDIANTQKVDIVLVAGDIFDQFNPPIEAIELFYQTVKKLSLDGKRPVIVIAGNHDSPNRIEAPDPLAKTLGIFFIGYPNTELSPFELDSGITLTQSEPGFFELELANKDQKQEKIRIISTAYANELRLKQCFNHNNEEHLNEEQELREFLAQHWKTLADKYCDNKGVNILLAHLFMTKKGEQAPEEPDDEKPILHIGGVQAVYSQSIPEQIQYTALGHLHRKQIVDKTHGSVVYSGTPIAYSFSEAEQDKYIALIDVKANKKEMVDFIPLQQGKRLTKQTFTNIDDAISWLEKNPDTLVELTLEMPEYLSAEDKRRLYEAHQGIIHLIPKYTGEIKLQASNQSDIDLSDDVSDLFGQYFRSRHQQQSPNEELLDLLKEVIATDTAVDSGEPEKEASS